MQSLFSTPILQRKKLRPEKVSGNLQLSALLSDLRSQGQEVRRALSESWILGAPGRGCPSWGWFLLFPVQGRNCQYSQISLMPAPHLCLPAWFLVLCHAWTSISNCHHLLNPSHRYIPGAEPGTAYTTFHLLSQHRQPYSPDRETEAQGGKVTSSRATDEEEQSHR